MFLVLHKNRQYYLQWFLTRQTERETRQSVTLFQFNAYTCNVHSTDDAKLNERSEVEWESIKSYVGTFSLM